MPTDADWATHLATLDDAEPNAPETIRLAAEIWATIPPTALGDTADAVRNRCRLILGEYCRRNGIDSAYQKRVKGRYIQVPFPPQTIIEPDRQEIVEPLKGWTDDIHTSPWMRREIAARIAASLPTVQQDRTKATEGAGKAKKRRGRTSDPDIDPKKDKRLCADWKAAKGQGASRDSFARKRGITINDLIAAMDREKYRKRRDAE